ncbi:MAG: tetratricopeptide repeat protein [Deltaproteobacteria bacterium]|nr:tetratricopeptide repeat protein [Deltaproteobacteria bacterium]
MSAYIAYRRYLASQVHPDDLASIEERIEALVEKSKALGLFVEGERAAQRENWPRATQLMRQTLEEKPNFSPAYRLLGRALAAQGQFTAAAAALRRYLELDPLAPDREEIEPLIDEYERALLEVVP